MTPETRVAEPNPPTHRRAQAAAMPPPEEARRQVTVLFCDLVGSTELSGALDPEELRDLLRLYQGAVAAAVEQFGGRLHHTLGDGIMASWGYPVAREDDAARAVLAGLLAVEETGAPRSPPGPASTPGSPSSATPCSAGAASSGTWSARRRTSPPGSSPSPSPGRSSSARPPRT
jgi:hypothetical protein